MLPTEHRADIDNLGKDAMTLCTPEAALSYIESDMVGVPLFRCYMKNKVSLKTLYMLRVVGKSLLVYRKDNKKLKKTLTLDNLHARTLPKQARVLPAGTQDQVSWWYPLKLVFAQAKKSRMVFLESLKERSELLAVILMAQGFSSQLEQYELEHEITEGSTNHVAVCLHKNTGIRVVVKATKSR